MSIGHALQFMADVVVRHGAVEPDTERTIIGLRVIDAMQVSIHDLPTTTIDDLAAIACAYATRTSIRA